jgi:hypothetical protein
VIIRKPVSLDAPRSHRATPNRLFRRVSSLLRLLVFLIAAAIGIRRASAAGGEIDLAARSRIGQIQQVTTIVEVRGELTVNADGQDVRRLPMEAKAELRYAERFLPAAGGTTVTAVRNYTSVEAEIRIQDTRLRQTLRPDRQMIMAGEPEATTLFSPSGPLTREELDLIDTPGASVCLDLLLPGKSVAIGDKWSLPDAAVSRILGLEAVGQQEVTASLAKVEDGLAIIELRGKVSGAVGGVSTEIDLQGKANYHLQRKTVSWLTLQYQEKRAVGHAQPGYDAQVRVRVQTEPTSVPPELADAAVSQLSTKIDVGQTLLEFHAEKAGIEFLYDRRWQVMVDRLDTVILRLIDRGDLIAQCNITRLPPLEKGKQLSLAEFQRDVEQTLSKNSAQIVEAAQSQNDEGMRVLRIVVSGTASELPIQWVYYHVSSAKGHRASLVFTMEARLVERFAQIDRELVENLMLTASLLDESKEPTPSSPLGKSAQGKSAGSPKKSATR